MKQIGSVQLWDGDARPLQFKACHIPDHLRPGPNQDCNQTLYILKPPLAIQFQPQAVDN